MTDWVASQPLMLVSGTKLTTLKLCTSQDKSCSAVTPSALDSTSGPALSNGGVAGIVFAVFVVLLFILLGLAALVIYFRKRKTGELNSKCVLFIAQVMSPLHHVCLLSGKILESFRESFLQFVHSGQTPHLPP